MSKSIILGLWPIAGMTTIGVTPEAARATIRKAIELGITRFDTAFSYGSDGESDRYLGEVIAGDRERFEVIGKVGQRWLGPGQRVEDGRPEILRKDTEESLSRIGIERFSCLMLHSIDASVDLRCSAECLQEIMDKGLAESIGICNATVAQRQQFADACDSTAIQCPLNLLQQGTLGNDVADAAESGARVFVYWTLMKGLLAGRITRDHQFAEGDSRPGYAVFQGEARERAHCVVDGLRAIAEERGESVASLSVSWAVSQPGVTAALVGARRPDQVEEVASAKPLDQDTLCRIAQLV